MLRRIVIGVLWSIPGYLIGAFGGGFLVYLASSNRHDVSTEAAMTGAFVLGPLAGVVACVVGAVRAGRDGSSSPTISPRDAAGSSSDGSGV